MGNDDADYFKFVSATDQPLIALRWQLECADLEMDELMLTARGFEEDVQIARGCVVPQASFGKMVDNLDGSYRLRVELQPREFALPGQEESYDPVNGFAPYASYRLTLQPTYAEPVNFAALDGDSASNPVTKQLPNQQRGTISAPQGDNADWYQFNMSDVMNAAGSSLTGTAEIPVGLNCFGLNLAASSQVVATVFDAGGAPLAEFVCDSQGQTDVDVRTVKFESDTQYLLRVQMEGRGSASWSWGPS